MDRMRIATRESRLAVWQAEEVARRLRRVHPALECVLVRMTTQGDRFIDAPLGEIGGKGLFVKELEQALLDGRADIAVHSMKDVTVDLPDGLQLPVLLPRANPRDALVSPTGLGLDALPAGARVGSSSLRRQCQLRARRPDLSVLNARGNVDSRLRKLDEGRFDALLLACAGLERLGLAARISEELSPEVFLPAIGQGAMGIECRVADPDVEALIAPLDDPQTATAVAAERAMNRALAGGCHVPVAGFAVIAGARITLRGLVGGIDGRRVLRYEESGPRHAPAALGERVAAGLLAAGAGALLAPYVG